MIKLLFHHRSRFINLTEVLALILCAGIIWRLITTSGNWFSWTVFCMILAEYIFIKYCSTVRWYKDAGRFEGIELQFKKALSPTVYILLIGNLSYVLAPNIVILIITAILLAVIAYVDAILIHLHRKDKDSMPVNYFSHNKGSTFL